MRARLLKRVVIAATVCSMSVLAPLSAGAVSPWAEGKALYEMRTLAGQHERGLINATLDGVKFFSPISLAVRSDGAIFVSDTNNHVIRLIKGNDVISYSGMPVDYDEAGLPTGSFANGELGEAIYHNPGGMAIDQQDQIIVADTSNHMIRLLTADGYVLTMAGSGKAGYKDGVAGKAEFYYPSDVAIDSKGNIYVADTLNHAIRRIDTSGEVTTLNARSERIVEYEPGVVEETGDFQDGKLSEAKFNEPIALAIDEHDNLYVSDRGNQRIRYINFETDTVSTIAGSGQYEAAGPYINPGYADGDAATAQFASPEGIAVTEDGTILVADRLNHVVRAINNGQVFTIAGEPEEYGASNGILSAAQLNEPTDVAILTNGDIAVADTANNQIRIIQSYRKPEHLPATGEIHVLINGQLLETEIGARLSDNRVYVPIRSLAEQLGMSISYNKQTEMITLINEEVAFSFGKNSDEVLKISNDENSTITLPAPTQLAGDRLLIPVRFIAEQLGYDVQWDQELQNVVVRSRLF